MAPVDGRRWRSHLGRSILRARHRHAKRRCQWLLVLAAGSLGVADLAATPLRPRISRRPPDQAADRHEQAARYSQRLRPQEPAGGAKGDEPEIDSLPESPMRQHATDQTIRADKAIPHLPTNTRHTMRNPSDGPNRHGRLGRRGSPARSRSSCSRRAWPSAHFLWLTCEREQGKPVVRAFLSETPIPDGPEFLKHIERSKITANGKALGWTKGEDTYRVNLPEPCPGIIDGVCDLGVMNTERGDLSPPLYGAGPVRAIAAAAAEAPDHLRMRLVARPGRAPVVAVRFRGKPAPGAVVKAFPERGRAGRAQGRRPGPAGVSPRGRGTGRPAGEVVREGARPARRQAVRRGPLLCHPDRRAGRDGRDVRGRRSPRPPLPSPRFPRRSTASAGPCSAIGSTSMGATPARRTNTAGRPRRSISGG